MSMRSLLPFGLLLTVCAATGAAQEPTTTAPDVPALIRRLGAERFEDREAAERALGEIGATASDALKAAADGSEDPQVRAAARRLLQRLEAGSQPSDEGGGLRPRGSAPQRDGAGPGTADSADELRSMMDRLDRDLGGFGGLRELRERLDQMQRQLEEGFGQPLGRPFPRLMPGFGSGTQIQIGPDGVRVEIQEPREDGGSESKVYEADSVEQFREQYPEVAERVFPEGGPVVRMFGTPFDERGLPGFGIDRQAPRGGLRPRFDEAMTPPEPGERLGVRISPVDVGVAEFLEIEPGLGLVVESVEDGSLAVALGLARKDVILAIGDQPIHDTNDVRRALRAIPKGAEVRVTVQRFTERLERTATKQHDAPGR